MKYADDTVIATSIVDNNDFSSLTGTLKAVQNWCVSNSVALNVSKSKEIVFSKNTFNTEALPNLLHRVSKIKFLGVILNTRLSWDSHTDYICSIAAKRLYTFRMLKPILPTSSLITIYCSLVRSLLDYASPVLCHLNHSQNVKFIRIQKRFHNIICCNDNTCTVLPDISVRRDLLTSRLFSAILGNPTHVLHCIIPNCLPSGRLSFPFCRTTRRLNSFIPYAALLFNEKF